VFRQVTAVLALSLEEGSRVQSLRLDWRRLGVEEELVLRAKQSYQLDFNSS
jgi:hypothetical protein